MRERNALMYELSERKAKVFLFLTVKWKVFFSKHFALNSLSEKKERKKALLRASEVKVNVEMFVMQGGMRTRKIFIRKKFTFFFVFVKSSRVSLACVGE
jgi:hypothetical protein